MKLQIGPNIIRSYKRLPYSPWHALAEFVDNSTQDYFNHKNDLNAAFRTSDEENTLEVRIVYESDNGGVLRIVDNAFGMDREDLGKALTVGLPPDDPTGRSRYGLGLKMAASWFGNKWTIVTKKLNCDTEFRVSVDVEAVASGNAKLNVQEVNDLPLSHHYTRIEITNLNRQLKGRTLGKAKEFIAGMYRLDIENGNLILKWNDITLDPSIQWVFLKDRQRQEYRKNVDIAIGEKRITGWVGVLETGGRSKAGFAMIHQGRMVKTWPDAWHPERIFGQMGGSNDLVNQRLVGEIVLDSFDISHTKDDIQWSGDEEDQVQEELFQCVSDYREVAQNARRSDRLPEFDIQIAAKALQSELESEEMKDLLERDVPEAEIIEIDDRALIEETDSDSYDFSATVSYQSKKYSVLVYLDSSKSPYDPYVLYELTAGETVLVIINMSHPHLQTVDRNGLLNHFRHCTYDALSEWRATLKHAVLDGSTIKRIKDEFLRLGVEIEAHESLDR